MDESLLEERIGYCFADRQLLASALTHRSFSNEQMPQPPHNERLEFLGDAVLDLAAGELVYRAFPEHNEGELTRLRAELVNAQALATIARNLGLGGFLRLGRGEERSGGRDKENVLADALEALIGAIYCEGGWTAAREFCQDILDHPLASLQRGAGGFDHKTRLQELLQTLQGCLPDYVLVESSGPDHAKVFTIEARLGERVLGRGQGRSKKSAEQRAAAEAMLQLEADSAALQSSPKRKRDQT